MDICGEHDKKLVKNVLIGCTGSVASLKLPIIIETLLNYNNNSDIEIKISVVATEHSRHFFSVDDIPKSVSIYGESEEWSYWSNRGDPVLHIDLTKWADILCIAPLDANTLAKMAHGICDNLLTCVTRAWNFDKPLLFCPAMNTRMWEHPVTAGQIALLKQWGHQEIPCVLKTLVCGDVGLGAMSEVNTIVQTILTTLGLPLSQEHN